MEFIKLTLENNKKIIVSSKELKMVLDLCDNRALIFKDSKTPEDCLKVKESAADIYELLVCGGGLKNGQDHRYKRRR